MEGPGRWAGPGVVAAVAVEAGVVSEFLGVIAEVELSVGLEETACGEDQLGLAGRARSRCGGTTLEDAVGAVAGVGGVAAALDLDVVDVLGVESARRGCWRCWCWGSGRRR